MDMSDWASPELLSTLGRDQLRDLEALPGSFLIDIADFEESRLALGVDDSEEILRVATTPDGRRFGIPGTCSQDSAFRSPPGVDVHVGRPHVESAIHRNVAVGVAPGFEPPRGPGTNRAYVVFFVLISPNDGGYLGLPLVKSQVSRTQVDEERSLLADPVDHPR